MEEESGTDRRSEVTGQSGTKRGSNRFVPDVVARPAPPGGGTLGPPAGRTAVGRRPRRARAG